MPRATAPGRAVRLEERAHGTWFGFVPGIGAGQRYALRVQGPWRPAEGLRHNHDKLVLDPYARAVEGDVTWRPEVFGHWVDDQLRGDPDVRDGRDSAPYMPRCVVVADDYDWEDDVAPQVPWTETLIYETHVRSLTRLHPDVPEELRGTYAGLAHPAALKHLRDLGVTTVELLPVQAFTTEPALVQRGLVNYWGYNTLGFFAPHAPYAAATGPQAVLDEFKDMVKALHREGLEVILDVVYNHTAEQGRDGATLSWRGLDNRAYYRLDERGQDIDVTGCGNTLDLRHPVVCRMVLDSLRYWVGECHVDGFRFDLAVALGRGRDDGYDPDHPFLVALRADPVLSRVKLIAEPWDVGVHGWRTGQFPPPFGEWNDRFRDSVRVVLAARRRPLRPRPARPRRARAGDPPRRVPGPVRRARPRPDRLGQLRRGPRRLHPGRHHGLRAQAQRRQRRGQPRRPRRQPVVEPRRRGRQRRRGRAARPPPVGAQPARHPAAVHRRADAQRRRRDRPHPAGQQQRLLPGQRGVLARLGPRRGSAPTCSRPPATWPGCAPRTRCCAGATSSPAGPAPEGGGADLTWFAADGQPMHNGRWDDPHTRTLAMHLDGSSEEPASLFLVLHGDAADATVTLPALAGSPAYELLWDSADERPASGGSPLRPGSTTRMTGGLPAGVRRAPLTRVRGGRRSRGAERPVPAATADEHGPSRRGAAGGSGAVAGQALATSPSSGPLVMPLWCGSTRTV